MTCCRAFGLLSELSAPDPDFSDPSDPREAFRLATVSLAAPTAVEEVALTRVRELVIRPLRTSLSYGPLEESDPDTETAPTVTAAVPVVEDDSPVVRRPLR